MSQARQTPGSNFGRRLLPDLVDEIARKSPQKVFISLAKTCSPEDGFEDISYKVFSKAINACCWWIESQVGRNYDKQQKPMCSGLMSQDLRHLILALASVKTGYVVSPITKDL